MNKIENIVNTKLHPIKFCKHVTQCTATFIKSMRKSRQAQLKSTAKALGISIQQLGKYESGINRISIGKLILLCDIYQYDIHNFLQELLSYVGMNSNDKKYENLNYFNNLNMSRFNNMDKLTAKQYKLINALINDLTNYKS